MEFLVYVDKNTKKLQTYYCDYYYYLRACTDFSNQSQSQELVRGWECTDLDGAVWVMVLPPSIPVFIIRREVQGHANPLTSILIKTT